MSSNKQIHFAPGNETGVLTFRNMCDAEKRETITDLWRLKKYFHFHEVEAYNLVLRITPNGEHTVDDILDVLVHHFRSKNYEYY